MISQQSLDKATNGKTVGKSTAPKEATLVRREIVIRGITPLLMHRVTEEELLAIHQKIRKPKNAPRPSPREECERRVHMHDGHVAIPAQNLLSSLIAAGQYVRLDGRRQMSTAKSTMLPAFLSLEEAFLRVIDPITGKDASWEVDLQGGRNPNGGELVCICRPRFDAWSIKTTIQLDLAEIGENTMRELFDIAARRIGLGDFRPQRKGIFGQWRIDTWKPVLTKTNHKI